MRILFVLEHFHPYVGGAETLFGNLATAIAAEGHEVTVVTSRLSGTAKREVWNGVEVVRVSTPPFGKRYFFMFSAIGTVLRYARRSDVIHTTTYNAAIPAAIGARVRGKPSVITVHEVFGSQWNQLPGMNVLLGFGYRLFEWLALHLRFDRFICDSNFTRKRLLERVRLPENHVRTVYPILDSEFWSGGSHSPTDLRAQLDLPEGTFLYLYFGRPGVSKGVEYLVEAAAIVRRRIPGSRLVMLLSDDPTAQYRRILSSIAKHGLGDHVVLLSPVEKNLLPGYLLAADCVVVPSISEGFGYSALEAASLGCRVIVTSGHASDEVLAGAAEFVPPRDPAAIANKIVEIATLPHPLSKPRRFGVREHVDGVLATYREVAR